MNWTHRHRATDADYTPGRYWPALTVVAWLTGVAGLLWLVPTLGGVHGVTATMDTAPLVVAGGPAPPVVGYLAVGQTHVYVPAGVPAMLVVGELLSSTGHWWGRLAAVVVGLLAAGQLLVLSGCGCGTGSVAPLAEAAVAA